MSHYAGDRRQAPPPAQLSMVDSMFLVAHHETTGKLRISLDLLGIGLVATALAELSAVRAIYLDPQTGQVSRQDATPHPVPAAQYVLTQIAAGEPATSVASDWMLGLRDHLYPGVADALEASGLVKVERGGLGRGKRYLPQRKGLIQEPQSWVYGILRSPHRWTDFRPHQQVVACVCAAMGIAGTVSAIPPDEATAAFAYLMRSVGPSLTGLSRATIQATQKLATAPRRST